MIKNEVYMVLVNLVLSILESSLVMNQNIYCIDILVYRDLIILLSKTCYEEINSIVKVVEHELIVPLITISFYNHKRCMSMVLELVYANTSG